MAETKKDMSEFVPMAKEAVARILTEGKDEIAERVASKVLESEGYLQTRPTNVTTNKNLIMQMDGKSISTVLQRMSQVFGGDPDVPQDVDFEVRRQESLPEPAKKRLIDKVLEVESGESSEGVFPGGPSEAGEDSGNGKGSGKVVRKRKQKAKK